MTDRTVTLYDGDVEIYFNSAKHNYSIKDIAGHPAGVTTILKRNNKPALIQWAANCCSGYIVRELTELLAGGSKEPWSMGDVIETCRLGKTAHRRFSGKAADIGTSVHKYAERFLIDGDETPDPEDPAAHAGATAFREWFSQHKIQPISIERIIYSKRYFYAGTCDFYGYIDDELCVLDFKTSSNIYPEMPLQLAAYARALTEELGVTINTGYIVRLDKNKGTPHSYKIDLLDIYDQAFINLFEFDKSMKTVEEKIDGIRKAS